MARFGKYELLSKIGEGGMAEVHLARASGGFGTEKLMVLKRLLPELAGTDRFVRMFLDEARLAVRLHHANIVQVYEADEADGIAFYAMEFLHGRDVRELMREVHRRGARVPLEQAIAIVLAACAALHYAHELLGPDGQPLGIVHRDVSPHNVFVLYDGVVKVIDFGIAKVASAGDRTATGMLKGKFGYMSPEQCLQQPVDRRSDVFCVGILLWELTTGQRLFKGPSEYQMVKAIVETTARSPRHLDAKYPIQLETIVMKALKRDRAARYATARELEVDLNAFTRAAGLDLAPASTARYMEQVFEKDVHLWRRALASPAALDAIISRKVEATSTGTADGTPTAPKDGLPPFVDETKSAAVTETLAPDKGGRLRSVVVAVVLTLAVVMGALVLLSRRDETTAVAPPAETAREESPAPAAEPASTAPEEPAPPETSSAAPAHAARASSAAPPPTARQPPPRRPKPAGAGRPKPPSTQRDPDAPLPR